MRLLRPLLLTAAMSCLAVPAFSQTTVVNVDATLYGYGYPTDPAPTVGQVIAPFSLTPTGSLLQLVLGAGTYSVGNATGMTGANPTFTGWRYNGDPNWVWNFVLANASTDAVIFYGEAGGIQGSQSGIASDPAVQDFSGTFTLAAPTTVDFMIRDYYLPDNAGGVALAITPVTTTPEPESLALIGTGLVPLLGMEVRRRRPRKS